MFPDYVWLAVLAFVGVAMLALVALLLAGTYVLFQIGRERRLEANAQYRAPMPRETPGEEEEESTDEEKASLIMAAIDAARDSDRLSKSEWRQEKLDDGWTEEDVEDFLANRPLLELN